MSRQLTNLTIPFDLMGEKEPFKINFETAVTEAIDEVFTTLGENVKQAIYSYLENKHGIKKEQIPSMIEGFTDAIESIFGDAAKLVELKIMEKLQSKVKGFAYKSKRKEVFFAEYLAALQRHLDWQCMLPNV
jgi:hypothetical protein